jgi:hypothetical protein
MTVAEMLDRISSHELAEWMAEERIRDRERAAAGKNAPVPGET